MPNTKNKRPALYCAAAFGAILFGIAPAAAQTAEEEIVVTARQRAESAQRVPIAITSVGADALAEARIDTLQEVEYSVPNLVFGESGSSGETHVGMRGIGDFSRNIGFDTRVGVYIDGVFAGQSLAVDQGLVDVAQVDVLRGPQGTLFGKNSSSGVISITTQAPQLAETSAELQVGGGNFDTAYGSAIFNLPLGAHAAARVSLVGQRQDGYVENLATGEDLLSNNHELARARIRMAPSDALTIDVSADVRRQNNSALFFEPEPDPFAPERFSVAQDGPLIDRNDGWGIGLTATYAFSNDFVLTSITGYRSAERRVGSDEDGSPGYGLHVAYFNDEFQHLTQEVRLASPGADRFRYVLGAYYFRQDGSQSRNGYFGSAFGAPDGTLAATNTATVDTDSWAVFANANLDISDQLTLSGGVRYTEEEKDARISQFASPAGLGDFTGYADTLDDDSVTATLSLQYQLNSDALLYASYARGHKSGGYNVDFVGDASFIPFDSESVDSFEAGVKLDLFDGRMRLNIAAFHAEYSDFQVFQFQTVGPATLLIASNAAEVTTQGVEMEGFARLTDAFSISYGMGYAEAEFDDFPGGATDDFGVPINIAGNVLPRAPRFTSSITARHHWSLGALEGSVALNHSYRGEQYFNPDNRARTRQGGYGLWNASLDIDINETWGVGVWGRNLTDEVYRVNRGVSFLGIPFSLYGQPRTYGAELRARF